MAVRGTFKGLVVPPCILQVLLTQVPMTASMPFPGQNAVHTWCNSPLNVPNSLKALYAGLLTKVGS